MLLLAALAGGMSAPRAWSAPPTGGQSKEQKTQAAPAAPVVTPIAVPAQAAMHYRAGDKAMRVGSFDDAAGLYAKAALAAPDLPFLHMAAGVALANIRRPAEAAARFKRASELAENDLIAALQYQGVLAEQGEAAAAQAVYMDAARRFNRPDGAGLDASGSISRLQSCLAVFPNSPILYLLLGDAHQMEERWTEADTAYRRAIALAPTWSKPRINYALSRLTQGKAAEAIQLFQAALDRDPGNVQVQLFKADAQREAGRIPDAINTYRQLENEPRVRVPAITGLGQAYALDGKLDQALQNLNRAKQIAPEDPAPQTALADVQARAGNFGAAAEAYDKALRLTRAEGLFGTQQVLYRALAESQLAARAPEDALHTLERALADEPDSAALWHRLSASAHLARQDTERAEGEFKASLDSDRSLYPYATLNMIAERGMLLRLIQSYQADLRAAENGGYRFDVRSGSSSTVSATAAATPSASSQPHVVGARLPAEAVTPEARARAHQALANLARYRGDFNEEVRQRESITRLRTRAVDFYLLGEACDQRADNRLLALSSYQKALNLGGLPDALATRARARMRALMGGRLINPRPGNGRSG